MELHWTIHKEAICVKTDFQNLSGGACHPNNCFDQSDSSSVTHALNFIHWRLLTSICLVDHLVLKCKNKAITLLHYESGSVYVAMYSGPLYKSCQPCPCSQKWPHPGGSLAPIDLTKGKTKKKLSSPKP